ncbi:NUDIX hydrolase [Candidatus Woesearchaeota archaeon]|nr:NUDIX hydrolase [Candidatus Woesearchaeota archaeon]
MSAENPLFQPLVRHFFRENTFRPTIVGLVFRYDHTQKMYLIVHQTARYFPADPERPRWQFPQGGIDLGESLESSLMRELGEELPGICIDDLQILEPVFHYDEIEDPTNPTNHGFRCGKAYIFSLIRHLGKRPFSVAKQELEDYRWVNFVEAVKCFNVGLRIEKARMLIDALHKAETYLDRMVV